MTNYLEESIEDKKIHDEDRPICMTNYLEKRLRIINAVLATVTDDAEIEILLSERKVILDLLDDDVVF